MARQTKKIAKRIKPKKTSEAESKKPEKVGKDYLLIIVLALTIVFMIAGWGYFSAANRGLYVALFVSLATTYVRRHYNLSEVQDVWAQRAGVVAMGIAIVLFAYIVWQQYIA